MGTDLFEHSNFGNVFVGFQILWILVFALVVGMIVFVIVRMLRQKRKNDKAPRLTVPATIVAKTMEVSGHYNHHHHHHHTHTSYFITAQVESGDRMVLQVDYYQYGMLVEGDRGMLTFQGTRFLDFTRE